MWFIFPQITGLGFSEMARHYAIADLSEARAYLAHPILGPRLAQSVDAMLGWAGQRGAGAILGAVDALKFASSMTLFEAVGGDDRFAHALDAFYTGRRDGRTLELMDKFVPQAG
jgi:uncharacterized protein (DUF1810 family)